MLYPNYINSKKTVQEGRRIAAEKAGMKPDRKSDLSSGTIIFTFVLEDHFHSDIAE